MSSTPGFLKGCRVLMAAAKASTSKSASATKAAAAAAAKPKRRSSSPSPSSKPRKLTGILKVSPVSPDLHRFLGVPETSRTDAVKKIWEYIKLHNLQNPTDKREIYCDDKLKTIFEGKDKVGILEIGKLLSPHFVKSV